MHHVVQNGYLMLEHHRDHVEFVSDVLGLREQRCLFSNIKKRIDKSMILGTFTLPRRLAQQLKAPSLALTFEPSCGSFGSIVEVHEKLCLFVGLCFHQHRL